MSPSALGSGNQQPNRLLKPLADWCVLEIYDPLPRQLRLLVLSKTIISDYWHLIKMALLPVWILNMALWLVILFNYLLLPVTVNGNRMVAQVSHQSKQGNALGLSLPNFLPYFLPDVHLYLFTFIWNPSYVWVYVSDSSPSCTLLLRQHHCTSVRRTTFVCVA